MSAQRGFALIEILLAVGLLAVAVLSVASMFLTAYKNVDYGKEQTDGVMLESQQMEFLRTQPFTSASLSAGTTTSSLATPYGGYTRTTTIADDTPVAGMKQITIQVTTPTGRTMRIVSYVGG